MQLLRVDEFEKFIEIYLRSSDIKGINRIVDIIHEKEFVFVLFETAFDDLHSYLKENALLDEAEVHCLFKQIVQIVHQLHQRNVHLNDLKLRKFVFADSNR